MIDLYLALKLVHVLSATVLFGTGMGIAFFMWMANRSRDAALIAHTARVVVIADFVFTTTAVVVQPLSGFALIAAAGHSVTDSWIVVSLALYAFVGACWLPVVWIQMQLRRLAAQAMVTRGPLPERYHRLFRAWFVLGWPAFAGVIAIFVLMLARPQLW